MMDPIKRMKSNNIIWGALLDFLELHPEMVTHNFVGLDGRQNYNKLWSEISNSLNSLGYGVKTPKNWIQAFTKWKSKVKAKAQEIRCGMKKTGGGGPLPTLSEEENRLMGLIGWKVVDGDNTPELGFCNTAGNTLKPPLSLSVSQNHTPSFEPYQITSSAGFEQGNSAGNTLKPPLSQKHSPSFEPSFEPYKITSNGGFEQGNFGTHTLMPPLSQIKYSPTFKPCTVTSNEVSEQGPLTETTKLVLWNKEKGIKVPLQKSTLKKKCDSDKKSCFKQIPIRKSEKNRKQQKNQLLDIDTMHSDTILELKSINTNVARLADSHQIQNEILRNLSNILEKGYAP